VVRRDAHVKPGRVRAANPAGAHATLHEANLRHGEQLAFRSEGHFLHLRQAGAFFRCQPDLKLAFIRVARRELLLQRPVKRHRRGHHAD